MIVIIIIIAIFNFLMCLNYRNKQLRWLNHIEHLIYDIADPLKFPPLLFTMYVLFTIMSFPYIPQFLQRLRLQKQNRLVKSLSLLRPYCSKGPQHFSLVSRDCQLNRSTIYQYRLSKLVKGSADWRKVVFRSADWRKASIISPTIWDYCPIQY